MLQIWTGETYRPSRDLDLLGKGMPNLSYQKIFSEVCSQDVEDDGLSFVSETIRVERIRDEEAYEGVRVLLEARLGNVRIPLQIDVASVTRSCRDRKSWSSRRSSTPLLPN